MTRPVATALFAIMSLSAAPWADAAQKRPDQNQKSPPMVVGGRHEHGYLAVGYLVRGDSAESLQGPACGATLIRKKVAVTAAHCVRASEETVFGLGLGEVGSLPPIAARAVVRHPSYNPVGFERYRHDIALLFLSRSAGLEPVIISSAQAGGVARYVGYGRTKEGDYNVMEGYTGERKSAVERIERKDSRNIWSTGVGGGLCWGDSGGPLVTEDGKKIMGVLADFDGKFECAEGNSMIFTSLEGEKDFIDRAIKCAGRQDCVDSAFSCLQERAPSWFRPLASTLDRLAGRSCGDDDVSNPEGGGPRPPSAEEPEAEAAACGGDPLPEDIAAAYGAAGEPASSLARLPEGLRAAFDQEARATGLASSPVPCLSVGEHAAHVLHGALSRLRREGRAVDPKEAFTEKGLSMLRSPAVVE